MAYSKAEVSEIVRRVLMKTLQESGSDTSQLARTQEPPAEPVSAACESRIVGEADVQAVPAGTELVVKAGALITPLARQMAMERGIRLVERSVTPSRGDPGPARSVTSISAGGKRVAVGADHGGFGLKEYLKSALADDGYAVIDCGTNSAESVDYPDYAYAVARLVSDGQAWLGVIVDGAGIGSCMAANKVPGVRAASCYDVSSASNAREHNNANVLTLGGGLIGNNLARQIVDTFLKTDFGGGRHERRVNKIMDIERRFLK